MAGLTVQNFVSAAVGMAVLAAVIALRAPRVRARQLLGRPGADHALRPLPLAIVVGLVLGSQGVIQTFDDPVAYQTLEARTLGATDEEGRR